jgi:hypothetical protein
MPLEQGHEHEERRVQRQEADVSRNVHGQSLDDAQAAFRAEWEAGLQEKRRQAERARRREAGWSSFCDWIYLRGLILGGGLGGLVGLLSRDWWAALILAAGGALAAGLILVPILVLGLVCKTWFGTRAQRLECELLEMELLERERAELPRETQPDALLALPAERQAEIREKRRQAEWARRRERGWHAATWKIFCTGAGTSVLLGLLAAAFTEQSFALATPLTVFSALLTMPLLCLGGFCEWRCSKRAEHLEQEARQLECAEPPGE